MDVEAPSTGDSTAPAEVEVPSTEGSDASAHIASIEEQRRQLAHAINEGPSQVLSNIVLRAEMIERLLDTDPPRAREESQRLREAAVAALGEVRRFVLETYPSVLEDLGLVSTLRRYLHTRSDHGGLRVELRVEGVERRLANAAELALFRFVQEALEAAGLHAEMREAAVRIAFRDGTVEAMVSGRPAVMPTQPPDQTLGPLFGVAGIQARLAALGGELAFDEAPGDGASLIARIPA